MLDTGTMIPFPYMMLVTLMMCVVEMFTSTPEAIEIEKQASLEAKKNKSKAIDENDNNAVEEIAGDVSASEENIQIEVDGEDASLDVLTMAEDVEDAVSEV